MDDASSYRSCAQITPAGNRPVCRDEWRSDHVFVKHPELLEWQHVADDPEQLTMVESRTPAGLGALLGFIPQWRFDPALRGEQEMFLALWKLGDRHGLPGMGVQLMNYVLHTLRPCFLGAVGLATTVKPLYRALRFQLGTCDQFVMHNESRSRFKLLAGAAGVLRATGRRSSDGRLRLMDEVHLTLRALDARRARVGADFPSACARHHRIFAPSLPTIASPVP